MILASHSVIDQVYPKTSLDPRARAILTELFPGECCEEELVRLSGIITEKHVDVMIDMGGVRSSTSRRSSPIGGIPVIVISTIASTYAPCRGCAVLYSEEGAFHSVCYQRANPAVVLVDQDIIVNALTRFLVVGMGDAVAT